MAVLKRGCDVTIQLVICDTCAALGDRAKGTDWAGEIRAAAKGIDVNVKTTSCMNMCASPVSFALQAAGKATYLFSKGDPDTDTENLIALLRLYDAAPDGVITDARGIGRLRNCLVGLVPKL